MGGGKIAEFLAGVKVLQEVESAINGRLVVKKDLAWGVHVEGGGLTQSGGIVKKVWDNTLRRVLSIKYQVSSCLVLGLGAGSVAQLVRKYWPEARITGVDLDPVMIEIGREYFGLDSLGVEIIIADGFEAIRDKQYAVRSRKYDLVCVDLYVGEEFPKKFEQEKFLEDVRGLLGKGGAAVFNRLYYGEKRKTANMFEKKLEEVFGEVERVYPEANVMFICKK